MLRHMYISVTPSNLGELPSGSRQAGKSDTWWSPFALFLEALSEAFVLGLAQMPEHRQKHLHTGHVGVLQRLSGGQTPSPGMAYVLSVHSVTRQYRVRMRAKRQSLAERSKISFEKSGCSLVVALTWMIVEEIKSSRHPEYGNGLQEVDGRKCRVC